jgi:hypothetical protein
MRKKLIKKVNILNRTTHINYYSNYILYNYLNNYNLKYYFLFNLKRKNYSRYINKFKLLLSKNVGNSILLKRNFNLIKSNMYINNQKDKFFKLSEINNNQHYYYKNYNYSKSTSINNNFLVNSEGNYLINNLSVYNTIILYKELLVVVFILNLSKIFEVYKILTLLVFFNSNLK